VEVRNGSIIGFWTGVNEAGAGINHRIINIRAINGIVPGAVGIYLFGANHLVQGCTACNNVNEGIYVESGTVRDCNPSNNNTFGIALSSSGSVIGNMANGNNIGFNLGTGNIVVDRNTANGNATNSQGGPANPAYWGINAGR
jgi:hypothetical protein